MGDIPQPIALIGAGAVGRTLARRWRELGLRIGWVACRTLHSATQATRFIGAGIPTDDPARAATGARLIALTVPDSAIAELAARLAASAALQTGAVVFHSSGALSSDILAPLRGCGLATGSLHPLQSFADPEKAITQLDGITYAVEGEPAACEVLSSLVALVEGRLLRLQPADKVLYHAAAAIISNYTVSLAQLATRILEQIGAQRPAALAALMPLLEGTLENLGTLGLPRALTGPIARGDLATVAAHLEALDRLDPEIGSIYRGLGRIAVSLAAQRGTAPIERIEAIKRLLETDRPAGS